MLTGSHLFEMKLCLRSFLKAQDVAIFIPAAEGIWNSQHVMHGVSDTSLGEHLELNTTRHKSSFLFSGLMVPNAPR